MNNNDLIVIRDRVLAKLKVGKQSAAGKGIDAFIRELRQAETPVRAGVMPKSDNKTVRPTLEQKPSTWESRADDFLKEVAGNG